jgi:hypothetical protein
MKKLQDIIFALSWLLLSVPILMTTVARANIYRGPDWGPLGDYVAPGDEFTLPAHRGGSWTATLTTSGMSQIYYVSMRCMSGGTDCDNMWREGDSHSCPPGSALEIRVVDELWVGWTASGESTLSLDPPVVTAIEKVGLGDATMAFNSTDFIDNWSDPNDYTLLGIRVESLPSHGTLRIWYEDQYYALIVGNTISPMDLVDDVSFVPETNWYGTTSFGWAGFNSLVWSPEANVNINIIDPNAPTVSTISKIGIEDTMLIFTETDFTSHFIDPNGGSLTKIQVISLPNNGTLLLSGIAVTENQEIVLGSLGDLTFEPDVNWNGSVSFSWNGSDGAVYAANSANVDIDIITVPDAPIVSTISKLGTENTVLTFTAADFTSHFTDPDGNSLTKIQIVSLPNNGTLMLSDTAVTIGQEIAHESLDNLTFEPEANWNGSTSFNWNGFDGTAYASDTANVEITINNVTTSPWWKTTDGVVVVGGGVVVSAAIVYCVVKHMKKHNTSLASVKVMIPMDSVV